MPSPSLKDIAAELDVSVSLVSKVLSGRLGTTGASGQNVERIRRTAEQMGYRRNRTAAALVSGRHHVIAVFVHRLGVAGSGLIESLVRGISAVASERGQRLWLDFFEHREDFLQKCPAADGSAVDGVIVGGISHDELVSDLLNRVNAGVPVITVHDQPLAPNLVNIDCDQVEVGRVAATHLIAQGCRQILRIGGQVTRDGGVTNALTDAGLTASDNMLMATEGFSYEEGRAAMTESLSQGLTFDGVVAQSDQLALGAMHELLAHGKRVPEDVRLIGVDDSPYCEFTVVPLSSVNQHYEARGRQAAEALLASVEGRTPSIEPVQPTVTQRHSTR